MIKKENKYDDNVWNERKDTCVAHPITRDFKVKREGLFTCDETDLNSSSKREIGHFI